MWRLPDLSPMGQVAKHKESVMGEAFLPGDNLLTISRDGTLKKYSIKARKTIEEVNFDLPFIKLALDPKENKLVNIDYDGGVSFLSPDNLNDLQRFTITKGNLLSLAVLPDGRIFCSGDKGGLYLVDTTGNLILSWRHGQPREEDLI